MRLQENSKKETEKIKTVDKICIRTFLLSWFFLDEAAKKTNDTYSHPQNVFFLVKQHRKNSENVDKYMNLHMGRKKERKRGKQQHMMIIFFFFGLVPLR